MQQIKLPKLKKLGKQQSSKPKIKIEGYIPKKFWRKGLQFLIL